MSRRVRARDHESVAAWHEALAKAGDAEFPRIVVVEEVDSTQDEIRRIGATPGTVVVALRQTRGRGQLDRTWADTGHDGVAMTVALPMASSAKLMLQSALATLTAMTPFVDESRVRLQLKWPNDVMVGKRKLAGVLVETTGDCALVGIGVNVRQRSFRYPLDRSATSIAMLGVDAPRRLVAGAILVCLRGILPVDDAELVKGYRACDSLLGTRQSFMHAGQRFVGLVLDVDPLHAITLHQDNGEVVTLPPETTALARPS